MLKPDLLYRDKLIRGFLDVTNDTWDTLILNYAKALNIYDGGDSYSAIALMRNLKSEDYCGIGEDERAVYYLHKDNILYWFVSSEDAMMFVNDKNAAVVTLDYNKESTASAYFKQFHRHYKSGFLWLLAEDLPSLPELLVFEKSVFCQTRNVDLGTREEAAQWLVNTGKAANVQNALKQLIKHLEGQTATCYGMMFVEW